MFIFDIVVEIMFSSIFNHTEQVAGVSMAPQAISGVLQNTLTSETTQVYYIIGWYSLIFHDICSVIIFLNFYHHFLKCVCLLLGEPVKFCFVVPNSSYDSAGNLVMLDVFFY